MLLFGFFSYTTFPLDVQHSGFGDRVFYETLLRQRPDSIMAQEWCVFYGVLPEEEAEKLNKKMLKRKKESRGGVSSPSPAKKKKKKAKLVKEEADDEGAGGMERVGSTTL